MAQPIPDPVPARPTESFETSVDVAGEKIHWDLSASLSYQSYLDLDRLLGAQHPRSQSHEEMLFIVIHQATELWMKLSLHELRAVLDGLRADDLDPAFKKLSRLSRIQAQLIQSWDVLSTLTPADYSQFRSALGTGSGFQSHQYRMLEMLIGNKNAAMIEVHRHQPALYAELKATLAMPSLYDEALRFASRRGFDLPPEVLERDYSTPYVPHPAVSAMWLTVYRDTKQWWELYQLAEKLVDLEDWFQQWRFRHMKTVERVIGFKRGTGGSSGVSYLQKALNLRFFPELWTIRTDI